MRRSGTDNAMKGQRVITHISLADLKPGQRARVVEVYGGRGVRSRLKSLGIRPGAVITKVSAAFRSGAVVVQVGGSQTAVGYGVAHKIILEIQR